LLLACLEEFLADTDPVTSKTKVIGDGQVTYRFIQSWTGRDGDCFTEFIKHPANHTSYEGLTFLYFWFPKPEGQTVAARLVAFSDEHLKVSTFHFQFAP